LTNYISFESLQSLVFILVIYGEIFVKINDSGAVIYQFATILFSYSRPVFCERMVEFVFSLSSVCFHAKSLKDSIQSILFRKKI